MSDVLKQKRTSFLKEGFQDVVFIPMTHKKIWKLFYWKRKMLLNEPQDHINLRKIKNKIKYIVIPEP